MLRKSAISKEELSSKMGLTKSFVGNVESYTQRHKYSTMSHYIIGESIWLLKIFLN